MNIREFDTIEALKAAHREDNDNFPFGYAFCKTQYKQMMEKWGFTEEDEDKVYTCGDGLYIRKTDLEAYQELKKQHQAEWDKLNERFSELVKSFKKAMVKGKYLQNKDAPAVLKILKMSAKDINSNSTYSRAWFRAEQELSQENR